MSLKVSISLLLLCIHSSLAMGWSTDEEKRIMKATFDHVRYDPSIRPQDNTTVQLNLMVNEFQGLDDKSSSLALKMSLIQRWKDPRLKFSSSSVKYLNVASPDLVWRPDTIFRNERDSQAQDYKSVRVFSTGEVLYTRIVGVTLQCPMNLRRYPFDSQNCSVQMSSHGFNTDMIVYEWTKDPIRVAEHLNIPSFQLAAFSSGYNKVLTDQGEFSVALADFVFKRKASYTVLTVFIPMIMFLIISMMSPWIIIKDSATTFIRVVISFTPLIICSNRAQQLNNKIPPVNYTKAIDVWTGSCVFFAFLYFVETVLAIYLQKDREDSQGNEGEDTQEKDDKARQEQTSSNKTIVERFRSHPLHIKIDWITRILMPFIILIFIIGFFATYGSSDVSCPVDAIGSDVTCIMEF